MFTNGKMIKGYWRRWGGDKSPAKYYDEDGREIVFNQGKTWICNIWQEYGEYVEYGKDDESLTTPDMPSVTSAN